MDKLRGVVCLCGVSIGCFVVYGRVILLCFNEYQELSAQVSAPYAAQQIMFEPPTLSTLCANKVRLLFLCDILFTCVFITIPFYGVSNCLHCRTSHSNPRFKMCSQHTFDHQNK